MYSNRVVMVTRTISAKPPSDALEASLSNFVIHSSMDTIDSCRCDNASCRPASIVSHDTGLGWTKLTSVGNWL